MRRNDEKKVKNKRKIIIRISIVMLFIIFLLGIIYIAYYVARSIKDKKDNENILSNVVVEEEQITETKTEKMLELEELKKENEEIIGWLEIEDTKINYPVVQTTDNDFYLTHNYKKEKSSAGSLFLDKDFDLENGSSNYLIYGHRSTRGLMFEDLMKYDSAEVLKRILEICKKRFL